jgi:CPA2 family monovalent cation:H+ antiporter-2
MTAAFELDFIGLALLFAMAFLGAFVAHRMRQSMVVGYILMGIVLGAVSVGLPDQVGTHLFLDTGERTLRPAIELLSDLGLVFLLFFIGVEFSMAKLRRAGRTSLVIALAHFSVNMYAGALVGMAFGWDARSTFFLAAVMTMSSLGVAAKSLIELRRLDREETEYVLGSMIVEDFLTMALLVVAMGTVAAGSIGGDVPGERLLESVGGAAIVYTVFIVLALIVIPRLARQVERVRSDEVFVLLALAAILGSAALAYYYGMPFMLGAFFIGMAFSESRISERLQLRLLSFRDAFVAVFFVGFGLRVDLAMLPDAIGPIAAALAVVVLDDAVLLSAIVYLMGFNARSSTSLGASLLGRSDDSILFASVGGSLTKADGSRLLPRAEQLYPFAGGVALVTSFICPWAIRKSAGLAVWLGGALPASLRFAGASIGRSMRPMMLHHGPPGEADGHSLLVLPIAYTIGLVAATVLVASGRPTEALVACAVAAVLLAILHWPLSRELGRHVVSSELVEDGRPVVGHRAVSAFVGRGTTMLLAVPLVAVAAWTYAWWLSPLSVLALLGALLAAASRARATALDVGHKPDAREAVERSLERQRREMERRYKRRGH